VNDSSQRAAIVGLSSASTTRQIARAAFESLAFRVREIAEAVSAIAGLDVPDTLPVDGGLATNDLFLQIQADALGFPVDRHSQLEATALGACIAAALGTGLATREELAPLTRTQRRFEPSLDPKRADERFARWRDAVGVAGAGT
jgi:glycerol kinase